MNQGVIIAGGVILAAFLSLWGVVFNPMKQFGGQQPRSIETIGGYYPTKRPGMARQGREVYRANGCVECHTQQVRPANVSSDQERGWARRRSVFQDYLYETPVMLGDRRIGPDLANYGGRVLADDQTPRSGHVRNQLLYLYNPRIINPKSKMPAYPYLFEKRKISGQPSPNALKFDEWWAPEEGYEVVPKPEAEQLVAYLLSLRIEVPLAEAPFLPDDAEPTPVVGSTNVTPQASVPETEAADQSDVNP